MILKPFWEKEYLSSERFAFGSPSLEVKAFSKLIPKNSRILDLGCGDGRNALYLAKKGFVVDCVDISENGIDKINKLSEEINVEINTFICDVKNFEYKEKYEMIIAHGLLQFIDRQYQQSIIENIKQHTKENGFNIISVFTDEEPAPEDLKEIMVGVFKKGEIKEYYKNWKIRLFESKKFHDEHDGGIKHYHSSDKLVVQKKI